MYLEQPFSRTKRFRERLKLQIDLTYGLGGNECLSESGYLCGLAVLEFESSCGFIFPSLDHERIFCYLRLIIGISLSVFSKGYNYVDQNNFECGVVLSCT